MHLYPQTTFIVQKILLLLLFILIVLSTYALLRETEVLDRITDTEQLRGWVVALGSWGPVTIMALMAVAIIINPIPSAPIALAAGALYGHTWGTLYVVVGATIGALGAFWIARLLGYDTLSRLFGKRLQSGWMGSQDTLMMMVLFSRLIPFLSFDLVSYVAGLSPIKSWRFVLATIIGLIPVSFILAHYGGELGAAGLDRAVVILLLLGGITLLPLIIKGISALRGRSLQPKKSGSSE